MRGQPGSKAVVGSPSARDQAGDAKITYEQPLNERVRGFLRFEHMFALVSTRIDGVSEWDSRAATAGLLDIIDLLSRTDLRGELVRELERHAAVLSRLRTHPRVDSDRLYKMLAQLGELLSPLRDPDYQPGQSLRQDELAVSIKQRHAILGGACSFDLPRYHYWLHTAPGQRASRLRGWLDDLRPIRDGIAFVLKAIRESIAPVRRVAQCGAYQQALEPNASYQLISVALPADRRVFPEISAGRHRFSLRFMEPPDTDKRPTKTERDIEFELRCCML